jgi:hypothetical protein
MCQKKKWSEISGTFLVYVGNISYNLVAALFV